jgi:hypothetical protein
MSNDKVLQLTFWVWVSEKEAKEIDKYSRYLVGDFNDIKKRLKNIEKCGSIKIDLIDELIN